MEAGQSWLYIFSCNRVLSRQPRWGSQAGGGGVQPALYQTEIWPHLCQTSKDATLGLAGNQL